MLAEYEASRGTTRPRRASAHPDPHITAVRRLPPIEAAYAPFPETCSIPVSSARFRRAGSAQPYTHQAEAIDHALNGRNVVVVTPTASGKTLCYNVPVLQSILADPSSRSLYLFPTKALAQDQLAELHQLAQVVGAEGGGELGVFTYDGDTPQDARRAVRARAHVVLTNPGHAALWHPAAPSALGEALRESEVRRRRRAARVPRSVRQPSREHHAAPGARVCALRLATRRSFVRRRRSPIPRELAERLMERPFELVDRSGAPRGEKFFVFVNPPVVNRELGIRRSYLAETRRVAIEFLKRGLQLIVFAQSRLSTEVLTTYLKDAFKGAPGSDDVIRGYRGGYLPLASPRDRARSAER